MAAANLDRMTADEQALYNIKADLVLTVQDNGKTEAETAVMMVRLYDLLRK